MGDESDFGKDKIVEYKLRDTSKRNLARIRTLAGKYGQYVINLRYLDTVDWTYEEDEIYSLYNCKTIYSYYHSECSYCQKYKEKAKQNPIIGIRIYPKGVYPELRKNREARWANLMPETVA